jgi:acyl dehydratase
MSATTRETPVTHRQVTDEELARLRSRLGQTVTVAERPYLTEVTRDAISNWAYATGDYNPLHHDPDWAATTGSGGLVAPPCMLYAFSRLSIGYRGGLPGVHSMFGGSHLKWGRPARLGARIGGTTVFERLDELPSRFAGRMFKQVSTTTFSDAEGPVGSITGWGMRVERTTARKRGKLKDQQIATHTPDDLARVAEAYAAERDHDFAPRPLASVRPGDRVGPLLRGPYTGTIAVAFEQAWGGLFVRAHGFWYDRLAKHPALGLLNRNAVPEPPEAVHWDSELARSVGVPEAYDYGPERISWMAVLLTNWGGRDAFLEELYCEIRGFNVFGDITYLSGTVREVSEADRTVTVDLIAHNQRDEATVRGWGRIRLAS